MQLYLYRSQTTLKYFAFPTANIISVAVATASARSTVVAVATTNCTIELYMDAIHQLG